LIFIASSNYQYNSRGILLSNEERFDKVSHSHEMNRIAAEEPLTEKMLSKIFQLNGVADVTNQKR